MLSIKHIFAQVDHQLPNKGLIGFGDSLVQFRLWARLLDDLMRGTRLGLFKDRVRLLVHDLSLKGLHAEAEVTDDVLEDVVVGDLLESECSH